MILKTFRAFAMDVKKEARLNISTTLMIEDDKLILVIDARRIPGCADLKPLPIVMNDDDMKKSDKLLIGEMLDAFSGYMELHLKAAQASSNGLQE